MARDLRGLVRKIMLVFDRRSGQKAEQDAKQSVGKIDGTFQKLDKTVKRVATAFAGLFIVQKLTEFFSESTREANELDQSNRRLAATAKLAGINLGFLQQTAQNASQSFKLSRETANGFTIEVSKLTAKAGQIERTGDALASFLDLGAAQGLNAEQTLNAIRQAVLGIDEGTDKLFQKNPSVLYAEFAASIGTTAGKLTDAQKAQAILTAGLEAGERVRGEYLKWLSGVEGQQFLAQQSVDKLQETFGKLLQPALAAILPFAIKFINWLTEIILRVPVVVAQLNLLGAHITSSIAKGLAGVARTIGEFVLGAQNLGGWIAAVFGGEFTPQTANALTRWADQVDANANMVLDTMRKRLEQARGALDVFRGNASAGLLTDPVVEKEIAQTLDDELKLLKQAHELGVLTKRDAERVLQIERELLALNPKAIADLSRRVELTRQLADATALRKAIEAGDAAPRPRLAGPSIRAPGGPLARSADPVSQTLDPEMMRTLTEFYLDGFRTIEAGAFDAASGIQNAFQGAFSTLFSEGEGVVEFFEALARGTAAALIGGVAQYASVKVGENIAQGFEDAAKSKARAALGDFAGAALLAASSKGHFITAGKWSLLAGVAGAAAAGVGSGGGGGRGGADIGSSTSNIGGRESGRFDPQTQVIVNLHGDFDALSPRVQDIVYAANQFATERFGQNARVIVNPRRGRDING